MLSFGGLATSLAYGTASEATKRAFGFTPKQKAGVDTLFLSDDNINRIVDTLCKVRGKFQFFRNIR